MEDNAKVFVFEKKEIFLIFVFVVIMSVTCFTLGVNLGKKLALEKSQVTTEDVKTVEMKSTLEADVEATLSQPELTEEEKLKALKEESNRKLNESLSQFADDTLSSAPATTAAPATEVTTANPNAGKFTIQLGSYDTMADAQQFAEGFKVRSYDTVIINEVVIKDKGTWYRVSLGLFDTAQAAKDYIKKEASLFQGQQYVIYEIK
ncbi:MAG: SPOR domain-containing protein [Bacteriovoracia bacterium]